MSDPVQVVTEALEREAHPYDFNMWGSQEFAECAVRALIQAGHLPATATTDESSRVRSAQA